MVPNAMLPFTARARAFWDAAHSHNTFPRDMERAIAYALPLAVVRLPQLTVGGVAQWLRNRGVAAPSDVDRRALRGCVFAHAGQGLVFLDGSDPIDEIRFVLAHEASHFMLHHLDPRLRAVAKLGNTVLEVLDGLRQPNPSERLAGVLGGVPLGDYLHAIERETDGRIPSGDVARMETEADILAFELLAPMRCVRKQLSLRPGQTDRALIASGLESRFGLPRRPAEAWAGQIVTQLRPPTTFADWLPHGP